VHYFDQVLPVEFAAINRRRDWLDKGRDGPKKHGRIRPHFAAPRKDSKAETGGCQRFESVEPPEQDISNDPRFHALFHDGGGSGPLPPADPINPIYERTRPRPVPCTARGLCFSGGGIRSAAICLGSLQALHRYRMIESLDYLSTVSGGGYIGSCLTAAMSTGIFPFGEDIFDSKAVAYLRDYSNYLLPRGRGNVRNLAETAAILLRGVLTNAALVFATLLFLALVTYVAYPTSASLQAASFVPRFIDAISPTSFSSWLAGPFKLTVRAAEITAVLLVSWSLIRSITGIRPWDEDTDSPFLLIARTLVLIVGGLAILDLQPYGIQLMKSVETKGISTALSTLSATLVAFAGSTSVLASRLGRFLKTSEHDQKISTFLLRGLTKFSIVAAGMIVPLILWTIYLWLCVFQLDGAKATVPLLGSYLIWIIYLGIFGVLFAVSWIVKANAYSLHRYYRDRLSKAFLFDPFVGQAEPAPLDRLKLSQLGEKGPYHIINSAMNVQGSREANKRGRNADFFMFTKDFVGSDLTLYAGLHPVMAETLAMEEVDERLNLGTAMAISGAAVAANMGNSTLRALSPTLALLNIRLGYWLRNPRDLAIQRGFMQRARELGQRLIQRFYLLREMLNLLDEKSSHLLLTDGGHIENLGAYELLKRGCQVIVVIDAEADPAMASPSLLRLERYARIDLGVRIALPWEEIAEMAQLAATNLHVGRQRGIVRRGPHCALGRIVYETGAQGVLLYFKSSLTGDEKDYILDYKMRYPDFPHETTADQFFSEEQFEAYRALGFHAIDGFFSGSDQFAFLDAANGGWNTPDEAFSEIRLLIAATVAAFA
jgi:hypothetical protein